MDSKKITTLELFPKDLCKKSSFKPYNEITLSDFNSELYKEFDKTDFIVYFSNDDKKESEYKVLKDRYNLIHDLIL